MAPYWSNHITNNPVSRRLKHKMDIVGQIIPFNRQDCTERLASSDGLAFTGVNEGNITTFHHFDILKGSVENPSNKILVCLAGLRTATMVVAPTMADINQMVNSLVPTFAQLAKCESREELCYLRKDAKINFKSKRITTVPPCFIEKIAQCLLPPPLRRVLSIPETR